MKLCKICKKPTNSFYDDTLEVVFHHCPGCNFIFKDTNYVISKKAERKQYEKHNNTLENKGYVDFLQKFIDYAVNPYLKSSHNLLDYGCGPNPVLVRLLDLKNSSISIYDPYFYPNNENLISNNFDIITCSEVCEHFLNPMKELKFLKSLLKKGAILSLRTEFHPSNLIKFKKWWYRRESTHISFYNKKTLKTVSDILKLKIVDTNSKNYIVLQKK